jgi:uncharacterized protein DUF551
MNNWIRCSERMPVLRPTEDGSMVQSDDVLVWIRGGIAPAGNAYDGHMDVMYVQNISGDDPCWHDGDDTYQPLENVTHWMPLPECPH